MVRGANLGGAEFIDDALHSARKPSCTIWKLAGVGRWRRGDVCAGVRRSSSECCAGNYRREGHSSSRGVIVRKDHGRRTSARRLVRQRWRRAATGPRNWPQTTALSDSRCALNRTFPAPLSARFPVYPLRTSVVEAARASPLSALKPPPLLARPPQPSLVSQNPSPPRARTGRRGRRLLHDLSAGPGPGGHARRRLLQPGRSQAGAITTASGKPHARGRAPRTGRARILAAEAGSGACQIGLAAASIN